MIVYDDQINVNKHIHYTKQYLKSIFLALFINHYPKIDTCGSKNSEKYDVFFSRSYHFPLENHALNKSRFLIVTCARVAGRRGHLATIYELTLTESS